MTSAAADGTPESGAMYAVPCFPHRKRMMQVPAPPIHGAPYVPSDDKVVAAGIRLAEVSEKDTVLDIGFGDGKVNFAAARMGARSVGWEVDIGLIEIAREAAAEEGLRNCNFRYCDCMQDTAEGELRELGPTVIYTFLLPTMVQKLEPFLWDHLQRGARIVTNRFHPQGERWEEVPVEKEGEVWCHRLK
eukprot:Hpha_TRINITY_DN7606_c0_g1::TRINITY_DN7606_c0_g1_i1::g.19253::m.19253